MKNAVIVAMGRSAIGKSGKRGTLRNTRPDDFASQVLRGVMEQIPSVPAEAIDDVILGCSIPEAQQGLNIARSVALMSGLGEKVPGQTINRFCSSGLQSIAAAANSIMAGQSDIIIAGGVESMSLLPFGGYTSYPSPQLLEECPDAYSTMGITAENVAQQYNVSREDQDEFSLRSHQLAQAARSSGRFAEEIIPVQAVQTVVENGRTVTKRVLFNQDEGIRENMVIDNLKKLRPVFKANGSVTAGNSSQTSDGAAFVVMMSEEKAAEYGLTPIARFVGFSVAGVAPGIMGVGPIYAIPKVLERTGFQKEDIDLFELNEAFASQALASVRTLG